MSCSIDQLDKADAPPIPEAYIYLLALQCLVSISEGFAAQTLPLFNTIVVQRSIFTGCFDLFDANLIVKVNFIRPVRHFFGG